MTVEEEIKGIKMVQTRDQGDIQRHDLILLGDRTGKNSGAIVMLDKVALAIFGDEKTPGAIKDISDMKTFQIKLTAYFVAVIFIGEIVIRLVFK